MTEKQTLCPNCSAPLGGHYCSQCGQRNWPGGLTFSAVAGEAFEEVFSWDSRIWRTLVALVFRPGFLTAEFVAGRRARYVPPFRLYLIISFFLFLVVSLVAATTGYIHVDGARRADVAVVSPRDDVAATARAPDVQAQVESEYDTDGRSISLDFKPGTRISDNGQADRVLAPIVIGNPDGDTSVAADIGITLSNENSPQWLKDLDQRLEDNAAKLGDDQGDFVQQLVEYMPQMMFLLLPVFALLLKFNYLFSPYSYLDHLVFSLHFHSFAYLLYLFGTLISTWIYTQGIGAPLFLVLVAYLPLALMKTYGSGPGGALGKSFFILVLDGILLLVAFALISVLTLALI